eukprot:TRINITY_DN1214_c0_g1_i14.p2 TRINITY_DN1214_c0_g1~~TRINITY_DN1214_c0_g1_i14.p2  ORF type:complete len:382 (-),score=89.36 TRINITY_DN1214_c0_g1_i14:869-1930(-)
MWSLRIRPNKLEPYVPPPDDNPRVHISQACLTPSYQEKDGLVFVLMKQNNDDDFVVISCLNIQNPMANLDLLMDSYSEFKVQGNAEVHLSGYLMPDYVMDDDEDEDYIGEELEEGDDEEIENRIGQNSKALLEDGFLVGEDDSDDDEDEELVDQVPQRKQSCVIEEIDDEDVQQGKDEETVLGESQKQWKQKQQQQQQKESKKQKRNKKKRGQEEKEQEEEEPTQKKLKTEQQIGGNLKKGQTKNFPNGFQIQQKQVGFDDAKVAKQGKTLKIAYVARLAKNGKIVDKSKKFSFKLGHGQVIAGMEEGCKGMRVGDERLLVVPPEMAYGTDGVKGSIPQNATMQFEISLLDVK